MKSLVTAVIILQFFAVHSIAAGTANSEYNPPAEWKTCKLDSDCVQTGNDCAGCCKALAINKAYKDSFTREFKRYCRSFHGSACECCGPDFEAKCQRSSCALVEVPGSKKRKCGG